jgi:hypothetical protein
MRLIVHVDGMSLCLGTAGMLLFLQMMYECGQPRCNDTEMGKPKKSEKYSVTYRKFKTSEKKETIKAIPCLISFGWQISFMLPPPKSLTASGHPLT